MVQSAGNSYNIFTALAVAAADAANATEEINHRRRCDDEDRDPPECASREAETLDKLTMELTALKYMGRDMDRKESSLDRIRNARDSLLAEVEVQRMRKSGQRFKSTGTRTRAVRERTTQENLIPAASNIRTTANPNTRDPKSWNRSKPMKAASGNRRPPLPPGPNKARPIVTKEGNMEHHEPVVLIHCHEEKRADTKREQQVIIHVEDDCDRDGPPNENLTGSSTLNETKPMLYASASSSPPSFLSLSNQMRLVGPINYYMARTEPSERFVSPSLNSSIVKSAYRLESSNARNTFWPRELEVLSETSESPTFTEHIVDLSQVDTRDIMDKDEEMVCTANIVKAECSNMNELEDKHIVDLIQMDSCDDMEKTVGEANTMNASHSYAENLQDNKSSSSFLSDTSPDDLEAEFDRLINANKEKQVVVKPHEVNAVRKPLDHIRQTSLVGDAESYDEQDFALNTAASDPLCVIHLEDELDEMPNHENERKKIDGSLKVRDKSDKFTVLKVADKEDVSLVGQESSIAHKRVALLDKAMESQDEESDVVSDSEPEEFADKSEVEKEGMATFFDIARVADQDDISVDGGEESVATFDHEKYLFVTGKKESKPATIYTKIGLKYDLLSIDRVVDNYFGGKNRLTENTTAPGNANRPKGKHVFLNAGGGCCMIGMS